MAHYLFSHQQDAIISTFETYDPKVIKGEIIKHLTANPADTVEHCRDYPNHDVNRHYGYKIVNFYATNPKNKKISLVYTKGDKDYYRSIQL